MAKVIERVTKPALVAKHRCTRCMSLVEYEESDVRHDQRDGDFVVCPVCEAWTTTRGLAWRPARKGDER